MEIKIGFRKRAGIILLSLMGLLAVSAQAVDRSERWFSGALLATSGTAGFDEGQPGWRSKLEFPVDGWLVELRGGRRHPVVHGRQPAYLTVQGRYAASLAMDGRSRDVDWDGAGNVSHYSYSDCTTDVRMWELKAGWSTVFDSWSMARTVELGFHVGYGVDWFDFSDENLDAVYNYGQTVFALDGPSATYEIEFRGVRMGGFAEAAPSANVALRLELDWIPFLEADADALWLLRDYPFQQEADGQGLILALRGEWLLTPALSVIAGGRYVRLVADRNGVESGVLDGMAYRDIPMVDELTSEYHGFELGAGWRF